MYAEDVDLLRRRPPAPPQGAVRPSGTDSFTCADAPPPRRARDQPAYRRSQIAFYASITRCGRRCWDGILRGRVNCRRRLIDRVDVNGPRRLEARRNDPTPRPRHRYTFCSASRDRCAEAARLRHRHLHPQPAAPPGAARPRTPSTCCSAARPTSGSRRSSGRTSARCSSRRRTTRCASRSTCRGSCARERPDVFHAPHYVLPPAVPLPLGRHHPRLHPPDVPAVPAQPRGLRPTPRRRCGTAAKRSDRILTVSEASKRDILHFFNVPADKGRRRLQRHRRALLAGARRRTTRWRGCASAISSSSASCSTSATSSRTRTWCG